jgi:hypothetical protein
MRRGLLLISAVLIALVAVPAATAVKPDRDPFSVSEDISLPNECAFPALLHVEGREIDTTFFDKDGNVVKLLGVFPGQRSTWTNLDTGKSITLVDSGSFHAQARHDGSVTIAITGHGPINSEIIGEPGLWYLAGGRVLLSIDAQGNLTSVEVTGNLVNLCTQLAS